MANINFKIRTDKNEPADVQNRRRGLLSVPRNALLGLIRLNAFGMASLLAKKAFEVNQSVTNLQPNGSKWWDIQAKWRNGWNNSGGDWNSFVSAVNAGKKKKVLGIKLAPKSIKDKLAAQGISGCGYGLGGVTVEELGDGKGGLGSASALTAGIIAATGLIVALNDLVSPLFNNVKKDLPAIDFDEDAGSGDNGSGDDKSGDDDDDDKDEKSLVIPIAIAAAAAYFFMKK